MLFYLLVVLLQQVVVCLPHPCVMHPEEDQFMLQTH